MYYEMLPETYSWISNETKERLLQTQERIAAMVDQGVVNQQLHRVETVFGNRTRKKKPRWDLFSCKNKSYF